MYAHWIVVYLLNTYTRLSVFLWVMEEKIVFIFTTHLEILKIASSSFFQYLLLHKKNKHIFEDAWFCLFVLSCEISLYYELFFLLSIINSWNFQIFLSFSQDPCCMIILFKRRYKQTAPSLHMENQLMADKRKNTT